MWQAGFVVRKKNICYNKILQNQENSGESHALDKSWRQVERLSEAGAVLRVTLLKYCNMPDEQGERISLDELRGGS